MTGARQRPSPAALARRLGNLAGQFGSREAASAKLESLRALEAARLPRARDLLNLHETLCRIRAYPDNAEVLAQVERILNAFDRRPDLRRHRTALADSGLAGTEIRYPFFWSTARWLAERFPANLSIDWAAFEQDELLLGRLHLFAHYAETPGLDEAPFSAREWIERMKRDDETDAAFVIRSFGALPLDEVTRETIYQELALPLVLSPGPLTPSRTRARHASLPVTWQTTPLDRRRPALPDAVLRAPLAVREVSPIEGRALIALAREAMVTRARDLDAFAHGDARDVRLVDCGGGLQFAVIGLVPERRLMLEAVYGYLTLHNGVPIGYVLVSALYRSSEIAYNVFETYRGGESGVVYGWVLAVTRHLFGVDSFTIYPYQLGHENDEGLRSGAWWFYQKLGFRPRDPETTARMKAELRKMKREAGYRSPIGALKLLAEENLYYHLGAPRDDVIGLFQPSSVGLSVTRYLAERFGSDRARAAKVCSGEASRLLGVRSLIRFSRGERLAWERWAPLVLLLPGIERWSPAQKRSLVEVIRAKGGRREGDFVRLFDGHRKLRAAVVTLGCGAKIGDDR